MKRLIVTADDFGASIEVNSAVEEAHRDGILTAASLMVAAPHASDALARAQRMPNLRVGLHLVLVEGRPALPTSAVSHLVDQNGAFRTDLTAYGALLYYSRQARRQLAAEITAQFELFRAGGLVLDHCNAHQHFHLHPVVSGLLIDIGSRFGLRAVRVPLEPRRVLRKIELQAAADSGWLTASAASSRLTTLFALPLRRRVRAAGLLAADQVFGLQWSGQMNRQRLAGLIHRLPDGLSEIYLHPATGPYPGAAKSYRYRDELEALTAPEVIAACRDASIKSGGFGDFCAPTHGFTQVHISTRSA